MNIAYIIQLRGTELHRDILHLLVEKKNVLGLYPNLAKYKTNLMVYFIRAVFILQESKYQIGLKILSEIGATRLLHGKQDFVTDCELIDVVIRSL